ncbi:MAG: hypothetical protein JXB26_16045 [Candidatus Aminicenantes bacterium]|nr:hypothetical protein [Candidatus Aminicenantes bacterium]
MELHKINSIPLSFHEGSILSRMGGKKMIKVSQRIKKLMRKAENDIKRDAEPKALFRISWVERKNGSLLVSNQTLKSRKLVKLFSSCDRAAVFLLTLGKNVDRLIQKTMKKRSCYGYVLDAAASVAAESMASYLQKYVERRLDEEESLTLRYSPGYCDWPLREQSKIFKILPNEQIGVSMSESYLMTPRKSISGIIGICPSDSLMDGGNVCLGCKNTNCVFRRN